MTTSEKIGQYIRSRRKRLGLTQAQLAEMCNLSIPILQNIENDKDRALLRVNRINKVLDSKNEAT